jgi:hypothetical protein
VGAQDVDGDQRDADCDQDYEEEEGDEHNHPVRHGQRSCHAVAGSSISAARFVHKLIQWKLSAPRPVA